MPSVNRAEFNLDLVGSEATKILLKPIFFDDSVPELFEVMPMVNSEQKMAYASVMKNVLQRSISCGMRPKGKVDIYERCINTDYVGVYLNQCFDEALNLAYQSLLKAGKDISDLTGTIFGEILVTRVQEAIKKDIEKLAFYGDKASADEDINLTDGMWVYMFDLVAKNLIPYVSTGSGTPLGAGDGIDILQEMYENQTNELKAVAPSEKIFLVSTDLYFQYQKDLREGSINSSAFTGNVQQGGLGTAFESIQVRPMWDWQQYALDFQGQADAHQAILTTRDNMVIATDVEDYQANLEVWYDRDSELNKVRSRFRFGFNYKLEEFLVAAF